MNTSLTDSILIVDDSPTDLMFLEGLLEAPGRIIHTAATGTEGLSAVAAHELAVIVLDVQLPDMSGIEVAQTLRDSENTKYIPIIFVSGTRTAEEQIFKGYDAGAVDYLIKPVNPDLLRSKVRVFCQLNAQRRTIEHQLEQIMIKNSELQERLTQIKTLRSLIPICASCKRVRDDSGYWESIEGYLREHSDTEFSHSICPDCSDRIYPDLQSVKKRREA